jgi:AcrR family transcriptional regulator
MYAKSAATITNILDAAQTLFVSKNYADVTMAEIAETAQVTKGALYHHFESKESLYVAMMLADLQEKKGLMGAAVEQAGSCRERLYQLTVIYLNLPPEKRQLIRLVRRDNNIFTDSIRNQLVRAYQEALPQQVEAIIRDGIEAGELAETDPRLLSWAYVALVEVLLSNYAQSVLGNSNRLATYVLDLFFNGAREANLNQ